MARRLCSVPDCGRFVKGHGLCPMHLYRLRKFGAPGEAQRRDLTGMPIEHRLWSRVAIAGDDECWLWTGRTSDGYGSLKYEGRQDKAHRVAYALAHGPIPDGLIVRHTCDVRACVNPRHLLLGTHADNAADRDTRGRNGFARKTHCKHGHEFTEEETYLRNGVRHCRACRRLSHSPATKALNQLAARLPSSP